MREGLFFCIPAAYPLLNKTMRMHHMQRHRLKSEWCGLIRTSLNHADLKTMQQKGLLPMKECQLRVIRGCSGSAPDLDNLYGGAKPLIDCLTQLGIIEDDKPSCVKAYECLSQRTAQGTGFTVIEVISLD